MMFWTDHNMSGWGYAGMGIGMVLFWLLVLAGIVALFRYGTGTTRSRDIPPPQPYADSPEQLLAIRFAQGEIDDQEYQMRLAVLRDAMRR
ncbi:putative membrane protein (DUF2078) [Mycolicibacterium chubuense NBB4]|uniref:Putative membrane protein (DUF2078) n=1 Tax=Mycolicibacterium chubuense (strain NBB4) TaxID=710421 RepID=I4BI95_MYCCN|nr:hypothetical protein [Mycolicibacterium chubuense]AFM17002.1 putative membrane protein (DUF2078) [Mycolicibacterium chubuense NBB4]